MWTLSLLSMSSFTTDALIRAHLRVVWRALNLEISTLPTIWEILSVMFRFFIVDIPHINLSTLSKTVSEFFLLRFDNLRFSSYASQISPIPSSFPSLLLPFSSSSCFFVPSYPFWKCTLMVSLAFPSSFRFTHISAPFHSDDMSILAQFRYFHFQRSVIR